MSVFDRLFGRNKKTSFTPPLERGDAKYLSVMALPDGIEVIHTPEKACAEKGGASRHPYTWLYKTSVRSKRGELTVLEFGAFGLHQDQWRFGTITGKPFTAKDFADWFACPNALLTGDQTYSDPQNWSGDQTLRAHSTLWYFLARNAKGELFKGAGRVEALAQLKSDDPPHPLLAELEALPAGIEVIHDPAEVTGPVEGVKNGWQYSWIFKTTVRSLGRELRVVQFGIIAWDNEKEKWVFPANQDRWNCGILDGNTFIQWYSAPGGELVPGFDAVDAQNWAGSRTRTAFRQKWFFIAEDKDKKRWKGEGVVHLIAG